MVQRGNVRGKITQSDILSWGIRRKLQLCRFLSFPISKDRCCNHVIGSKAPPLASVLLPLANFSQCGSLHFSPHPAVWKPLPSQHQVSDRTSLLITLITVNVWMGNQFTQYPEAKVQLGSKHQQNKAQLSVNGPNKPSVKEKGLVAQRFHTHPSLTQIIESQGLD